MLEASSNSIDGGDVVRPAGGIPVPVEQFFEHISHRNLYPDPVQVEHVVLGDILTNPLQHGLRVIFSFFMITELDFCGDGRLMEEKIEGIGNHSRASFRRGFLVFYYRTILVFFTEIIDYEFTSYCPSCYCLHYISYKELRQIEYF